MNSRKSTSKALTLLSHEIQILDSEALPLKNPIFSLTTINLEKSLKHRKSLPKRSVLSNSMTVPTFSKTEKTPKPVTDPSKNLKKFSTIDWNDFLKSNSYKGNIVPLQKPSEKIQEKLQEIDSKINSEANSTQDTIFFKSIKKIDRSANIEAHLQEIKGFTLTKKETFNEIHKNFLEKSKRFEDLSKILDDLEAFDVETKKIEDHLENKKGFLEKVRNDLLYENSYSETLKMMLKRSRELLDKEIFPINGKNQELFRIGLEIKKETRDLKQVQFEEKQLMKKFKRLKNDLMVEKDEKTQGLDFMFKIYEDQQRLKKYLEIEHKKHELYEKTKQNNVKLLEFEQKIARLKKHNILNKEYSKLNKMLEHQERKFRTIQKITNSSKIEDVLPYFEYLQDIQNSLQRTLEDSLKKIDHLKEVKKLKLLEYNSLFTVSFDTEADEQLKKMTKKGQSQEILLKKKELELEKLNQLVLSAMNTLSRLVFQLAEESDEILSDRRKPSARQKLSEDKSLKVQQSNINYLLGFCCIKIEKIMEAIQSHQSVYYIESINTDMNFKSPPNFLKLLNVVSRKKASE